MSEERPTARRPPEEEEAPLRRPPASGNRPGSLRRACRIQRRGGAGRGARREGFTLLEVIAALLIAAVALTYLISAETESIRRSSATRDLREATTLAKGKLMEIVAGAEGAGSGDFEGRPGWSWQAAREPAPDAFGLEKLVLTVRYLSRGKEETVVLEELCRP